MSTFAPLSSLPPGLHAAAAGWDAARPSSGNASGYVSDSDAARTFGFDGHSQAARVLSVPAASGSDVTQLEARFLACLFEHR